uniref:UTP--glucose-1-phosphate uridylyltransferase n=1 Tax=Ditylum brightwellii TaxID=49249 RepID=A0A7S1ZFQ5_9STRA
MGGKKGKGLEFTTRVNDIPKGSRLAVSTNLLGSIISLGMRATCQTENIVGDLTEKERRLVAARAILGEWLGGSGGGWQDSGGVWPGIKLIQGVPATEGDPEYGLSRGRLLPVHRRLTDDEAPASLIKALHESLVLVHGGMSQNVGPVLEMVTEKYLLREPEEWKARHDALGILDDILVAFADSNVKELAKLTTRNFFEPIQTIIPWATNLYTETLITRTKERFGERFWGFWMLGGCSGGGMGFIFDPEAKAEALNVMQEIMLKTKREMEDALPFAMDPVVYDFSINDRGTSADWCDAGASLCQSASDDASNSERPSKRSKQESLEEVLTDLGFDRKEHEKIRSDMKNGVIGLAQNRLPMDTKLEGVQSKDIIVAEDAVTPAMQERGLAELKKGTVGVVTLAAGVGSRWTQGAGVVKAINPFAKLGGQHRSFLEVHLAKNRNTSELAGTDIPHVFTTSHMTDGPIASYLDRVQNHNCKAPIYQSHGKTIGLRLVPTIRDLKFAWEELQQQKLDEQEQKVRDSLHTALMKWAEETGEASDYRDNIPLQCLHPVGHFYEIPNLLLNGTLRKMLSDRPQLKYLMLHNIDTVGANVDPGLLGLFLDGESDLSFEVVPRCIDDRGGGLARVNGTTRLVEGLSLPREEDEFKFCYYNSMTTWIDIDKLLTNFGLERSNLSDKAKVTEAVHKFSHRLPTYVTIKEVKKRWGNGMEDVHPVAQFEKLWSDLTSLDDMNCQFVVVERKRGQQLKDVSQLDGWLRDGSAEYIESICSW